MSYGDDDARYSETREEEQMLSRGRPEHLIGPVLRLTWHKTFEDRILGLAAEAGFWAIVSLPSSLLAVFGALGYLRGVLS
ncbi:MAG: hypothetical protein ACRDZY_15445, partial [Acidimicrobiales bacterium]